MLKHGIRNNKIEDFEGGHYARTEEELFKEAFALLDKREIEDRP